MEGISRNSEVSSSEEQTSKKKSGENRKKSDGVRVGRVISLGQARENVLAKREASLNKVAAKRDVLARLVVEIPELPKADVLAAEKKVAAPQENAEPTVENQPKVMAAESVPQIETEKTSKVVESAKETTSPKREYDEIKLKEFYPEPEMFFSEGTIYLHEPVPGRSEQAYVPPESIAQTVEPTEERRAEAPRWQRQPERPHMARTQESPEPEPESGAVFASTETVDIDAAEAPAAESSSVPAPAFERAPFHSEPEPAEAYRQYMEQQTVAAAQMTPGSEAVATKQEVADAVHRATKSGLGRGLATGLLIGGAYEHFKHKRREKKAKKRFDAQTKQLNAARKSYEFAAEDHAKQQAETTAKLNTAERRFDTAEKRLQTAAQPEQQPLPRTPNQQQIAPENPEQLVVPTEHRIETSAWHSIEVDAKTGKAVETPTFQYGHEYYRERAQEGVPALQRDVATGGIALAAASAAQQSGSLPPAGNATTSPLVSAQIPDATTQGPPQQTQQKKSAVENPTLDSTDTKPLWPWVVALVVVVICLIVALS